MEDDRVILLNNAGEPEGEEDNLNLTDPTGPFFRSINTYIKQVVLLHMTGYGPVGLY